MCVCVCGFSNENYNIPQMVEYLVGDGPNNRYALICSQCHSHNGMALRDEFEYLNFRCAYCYHLNPARKKKPTLEEVGGVSSTHPTARRDRANSSSSKDDNEQVIYLPSILYQVPDCPNLEQLTDVILSWPSVKHQLTNCLLILNEKGLAVHSKTASI